MAANSNKLFNVSDQDLMEPLSVLDIGLSYLNMRESHFKVYIGGSLKQLTGLELIKGSQIITLIPLDLEN